MSLQGSLSIEHMCELAGVSRAGFYRSLLEQRPVEEGMEVRSTIQQIALGHRRRYGSSTDFCGVAPTGNAGEPQEGSADDAGRQPAGRAATAVHGHDRFELPFGGLPQSSQSDEADWH